MDGGALRTRRRAASWTVATVALALMAVVTAAALRPARPAAPSTYRSSPGGMRLLYVLLRQQGVRVGRWRHRGWPEGGLLVGAVGRVPPTLAQARSLRAWVAAGHRAVLAGTSPSLAQAFGLPFASETYPVSTARAAVALPALRGADAVRLPGLSVLLPGAGGLPALPLYTAFPGVTAAVRLRVGTDGSVVWFGSAGVWTNGTLAASPANLRLAFNLLDTGGRVWFDEAVFGAGLAQAPPAGGTGPVARRPGLPWPAEALPAAATLALAGLVSLWSAAWRRLPVRPDAPLAPSTAESVRAYGMLLYRARAGRETRRERPAHVRRS